MLAGGRSSLTVTVCPEKTVADACWLDTPPPSAGTVATADPDVAGSSPVMDRPAWSPAAPLTHALCTVSVACVRVLVKVHRTSTGSSGTSKLPVMPSTVVLLSQARAEV